MAAKCRCGERIEWRLINTRRLAYETDGWVHDCPLTPDKPVYELTRPGPKPVNTVHFAEPPPPPCDHEPAVINSRDYDQHVVLLAAELGVRQQDLAYTVAYRAACKATATSHTAA